MNNFLLIIIVTYNGIKWLNKCLNSIRNSTVKADIFIIDNGSTDSSIDYIKKNYPEAKLIVSNKNLGFGKANNIGMQYALDNNYEFVYLINQDAWVVEDTFAKLIEVSQRNSDFGILSPLHVNNKVTKLDSNFASFLPKPLISDIICKQKIKSVYETNFVMAAHWLITRSCLTEIGGFSPAFQHYGEDNNYVNRAQFKNYKIGIVPSTIGIHDREDRPLSMNKKKYMHYISNLIIANSPLTQFRLLYIIKNILSLIIKHPSEFKISYSFKIIIDCIKARKFRKKYIMPHPFLD